MFYDTYTKLCAKKGISPTRAAEEIGISRATPTTWKKRGLTPQGETLNKIANYFGVTIDYLIGTSDFDTASTLLENEINSHAKLSSVPTTGDNKWDISLREMEGLIQALNRGVHGSHTLYQIETTIDRAIDLKNSVSLEDKQRFLVILADIERNLIEHDVDSLQDKIRNAKGQLL